jgi:stage III sporulation protein SpoIIIAA
MALNLAKTMHDNRQDVSDDKDTDFRNEFIVIMNERMSEYSAFSFEGDYQPGFQARRTVGENVRKVMGEKDNKWIPDQVMDIEIPDAMKAMKRITRGVL